MRFRMMQKSSKSDTYWYLTRHQKDWLVIRCLRHSMPCGHLDFRSYLIIQAKVYSVADAIEQHRHIQFLYCIMSINILTIVRNLAPFDRSYWDLQNCIQFITTVKMLVFVMHQKPLCNGVVTYASFGFDNIIALLWPIFVPRSVGHQNQHERYWISGSHISVDLELHHQCVTDFDEFSVDWKTHVKRFQMADDTEIIETRYILMMYYAPNQKLVIRWVCDSLKILT